MPFWRVTERYTAEATVYVEAESASDARLVLNDPDSGIVLSKTDAEPVSRSTAPGRARELDEQDVPGWVRAENPDRFLAPASSNGHRALVGLPGDSA